MSKKLDLGKLLLGVATAATQIEGGDRNNSWYSWAERKNHIKDNSSPLRANDHWNRFREDIALMKEMKISIYRFGLEWSRIEPEKHIFSKEAIKHYKEEIELLKKNGIQPLVTLHHFSNPLWFENMGGFENPASIELFTEYVAYTVKELGSDVSEWITINEPNIYTVNGYFFGMWPPGKKRFSSLRTVYTNLAACHIKSYKIIHDIYDENDFGQVKVGFANYLRVFVPYSKTNLLHVLTAKFFDKAFQESLSDAFCLGKVSFPVKKSSAYKFEKGRYFDFIGINYYSRGACRFFKDTTFENTEKNDLGWEIYPKGISFFAERMFRKYNAPIYITENGTCDKDDKIRAKYIYSHLKELIDSGLPVERYYHWTFIDNFEWAEGEEARFGLVALDFETQKRTIRESGRFYTEIIENNGVTDEMYNKYVH